MVSGGLCVWILCRSGRLLTAKPSFFRLCAAFFRSLGGFVVSGQAVFIPVRHCVRQARFPSSPFVLGDVCAGFWRQIKEAPGISRFFGDVCESFGCRLEDSTGETVF